MIFSGISVDLLRGIAGRPKSLAQTWLKRTQCMPLETRMVPRFHYAHISSRQGRPKQTPMTETPIL